MERLKEKNFSAPSLTFDPETPSKNHHDELPDVVRFYLEEIRNIPLLTREEEQEIFRRMEKAKEAERELNENHNLSDAEKENLQFIIQQGEQARDKATKANQRLVISQAKKYIGRGVPLLDLIGEGNIGLIRAVDKFDYHRGFKLSTYATWWIRQALTRAVPDQGRTIRLPVHKYEAIRKLGKIKGKLTQTLGREPTIEELAEGLQLKIKKTEELIQIQRQVPASLDEPVHPEEGSDSPFFGDFVENGEAGKPGETTDAHPLQETIENLLSNLTPREAAIIRWRYGLVDGHCYTLREVGEKLGLTRERIRQIEHEALQRLRHPSCLRKVAEFY